MGFELKTGYECPVCGEVHAPLPLSFSAKAPAAVGEIAPAERVLRVVISADQCVVDERRFFLRGRVLVPVHGVAEPFIWGVWAEVSATDFYRAHQQWTVAGRERSAPFSGRLATEIPFFAGTPGLALRVHTQPVGERPHFELLDTQHPMAVEQREGLALERVVWRAARERHGLLAG